MATTQLDLFSTIEQPKETIYDLYLKSIYTKETSYNDYQSLKDGLLDVIGNINNIDVINSYLAIDSKYKLCLFIESLFENNTSILDTNEQIEMVISMVDTIENGYNFAFNNVHNFNKQEDIDMLDENEIKMDGIAKHLLEIVDALFFDEKITHKQMYNVSTYIYEDKFEKAFYILKGFLDLSEKQNLVLLNEFRETAEINIMVDDTIKKGIQDTLAQLKKNNSITNNVHTSIVESLKDVLCKDDLNDILVKLRKLIGSDNKHYATIETLINEVR